MTESKEIPNRSLTDQINNNDVTNSNSQRTRIQAGENISGASHITEVTHGIAGHLNERWKNHLRLMETNKQEQVLQDKQTDHINGLALKCIELARSEHLPTSPIPDITEKASNLSLTDDDYKHFCKILRTELDIAKYSNTIGKLESIVKDCMNPIDTEQDIIYTSERLRKNFEYQINDFIRKNNNIFIHIQEFRILQSFNHRTPWKDVKDKINSKEGREAFLVARGQTKIWKSKQIRYDNATEKIDSRYSTPTEDITKKSRSKEICQKVQSNYRSTRDIRLYETRISQENGKWTLDIQHWYSNMDKDIAAESLSENPDIIRLRDGFRMTSQTNNDKMAEITKKDIWVPYSSTMLFHHLKRISSGEIRPTGKLIVPSILDSETLEILGFYNALKKIRKPISFTRVDSAFNSIIGSKIGTIALYFSQHSRQQFGGNDIHTIEVTKNTPDERPSITFYM